MRRKFEQLKFLTSKIGSGATPTGGQSSYKDSGIALIRSQNVLDLSFSKDGLAFIDEKQAEKLGNVEVYENDILLNITGDSIARVCKAPKAVLPARVNQHVSILRSNSKITSDYLLYYLIFRKNYLLTISRVGGTRNALTKEAVENIEIRLDEKHKELAAVLSSLDNKIELNNRINTELEQMAKTLYDYWFVQFDFPDANGKPYKSSGGKMLYDDVLKREVPEGWEVKSLFEVCNVQYGFPFSTSFFNDEGNGIPVIRIRDIINNSISNFSTQEGIDEKYKIKQGDILIGMDGNFHINFWSNKDCYLNQRVVKLGETILPAYYLKYQTQPFIEAREQSVSRTTVGHLSDKDLKAINIIVPDSKIINAISPVFKKSLEKIISNQQENQQLSALRDWLLPMLMNGQATVSDVAKIYNKQQVVAMAAEAESVYKKTGNEQLTQKKSQEEQFDLWLQNQGLAARGEIDATTLRAMFDAMDDEDK